MRLNTCGDLFDRPFDFLLEPMNISRLVFEELHDRNVSPKGLRILGKTNLLDRYVDLLTGNFENFDLFEKGLNDLEINQLIQVASSELWALQKMYVRRYRNLSKSIKYLFFSIIPLLITLIIILILTMA